MTLQQSSAAPSRLSFGAMAGAAHDAVFGHFHRFARLAAIPFVLALALSVLAVSASLAVPGTDILFLALDLIPYALLGIALSRVLLMGEEAGLLPPQPLGRRTWIYVGYTLLMTLAVAVPVAIAVIAGAGVTSLGIGTGWTVATAIAAFLVLLYVLTRFSLVFPALSVDRKLGLVGSWRLTRGSGLKLFGAFLVILLVTVVVGAVGSAIVGGEFSISIGGGIEAAPGAALTDILFAQAPAEIWSTLVSLASLGLMTGAYASAYAQLSGWGGPRQEILERFE